MTLPEKRVHRVQRFTRIIPVDKQDESFIDKLKGQERVKVVLQRSDCEDYFVDADKKLHYPVKCVCINAIPFYLVPGENMVPIAVYEFLEQNKQDAFDAYQRNQGLTKAVKFKTI